METRKIGRPPKSESDRRQQIGVRTSPSLKMRLEQAAASNGRSVAQEAELRLVQSFEADDLVGGPEKRRLAVQIASEIARAEAASGKGRASDLATHIAATKLIKAVLARATPIPNDFERLSAVEGQIKRKEEERERLCQVLAQFNVFSRSAFSALLGNRGGYVPVEDESRWINPDDNGAPLSNGLRAVLREKRDELAGLEAELAILHKERATAEAPITAAVRRGGELYDQISGQSGLGGNDGA